MKMPRYLVRIGMQQYVVSNKNGVGAVMEFLRDAMPVTAREYKEPMEIELTYADEPSLVEILQQVESVAIPANVIWKLKTKTGEVNVVRPVEKKPRAINGHAKALPGPKRAALPAPDPQRPLELGI